MSILSTVKNLKENNQDFEFYPTSAETIRHVISAVRKFRSENYSRSGSILDIGAGNGKVLQAFKDSDLDFSSYYAIEKSAIQLSNLNKDFLILGVDFHKTTLIDKECDVIFSNPPYSEFVEWSTRIINEAQCRSMVFLLIPERWKSNQAILDALKDRKAKYEVIHSFDFMESEDRKARAKVDLIQIKIPYGEKNDSFERFFDENFKYPEAEESESFEEKLDETKLVGRLNLVEALCELYDARMTELYKSYQSVCDLDASFLKEFEITKKSLIESLKLKIKNAKKEYWQRLFDNLDKIHERLTKNSREKIVRKMNDQTGIEFNRDNVYAILTWVIRHANNFFDTQFIETYEKMVDFANVENYKSNQRVFKEDQFKYYNRYESTDSPTHYKLKAGNRIVLEHCGGLSNSSWSYEKGLEERAADFLGDLMTIARNLNFIPNEKHPKRWDWDTSEAQVFTCKFKGEDVLLFKVKCYKNQNMHIHFNPDFVHALNIMHGKLKKWVMEDDIDEVVPEDKKDLGKEVFGLTFHIGREQLLLT